MYRKTTPLIKQRGKESPFGITVKNKVLHTPLLKKMNTLSPITSSNIQFEKMDYISNFSHFPDFTNLSNSGGDSLKSQKNTTFQGLHSRNTQVYNHITHNIHNVNILSSHNLQNTITHNNTHSNISNNMSNNMSNCSNMNIHNMNSSKRAKHSEKSNSQTKRKSKGKANQDLQYHNILRKLDRINKDFEQQTGLSLTPNVGTSLNGNTNGNGNGRDGCGFRNLNALDKDDVKDLGAVNSLVISSTPQLNLAPYANTNVNVNDNGNNSGSLINNSSTCKNNNVQDNSDGNQPFRKFTHYNFTSNNTRSSSKTKLLHSNSSKIYSHSPTKLKTTLQNQCMSILSYFIYFGVLVLDECDEFAQRGKLDPSEKLLRDLSEGNNILTQYHSFQHNLHSKNTTVSENKKQQNHKDIQTKVFNQTSLTPW